MKAIFEFDMNDPDDIMAHNRATQALDMASALWEIIYNTRKGMHNTIDRALEQDKNFTPYDAVDLTFDAIRDIIDEHGIVIDKLIN
jgi:hypothetical protein